MFPSTLKHQAGVVEFLRFEERCWKAPFSVDNFSGLVWTVDLIVEIKLRFQIFFGGVWMEPETGVTKVQTDIFFF